MDAEDRSRGTTLVLHSVHTAPRVQGGACAGFARPRLLPAHPLPAAGLQLLEAGSASRRARWTFAIRAQGPDSYAYIPGATWTLTLPLRLRPRSFVPESDFGCFPLALCVGRTFTSPARRVLRRHETLQALTSRTDRTKRLHTTPALSQPRFLLGFRFHAHSGTASSSFPGCTP
ncbi:hypothetical protein EXIGLDRAFT_335130 [Exidia glandulosa HHB12029]|uniref:Uncharacterized protein n=1 Tax=Exidia glandulosa HHB12029 TaxID=1314781 RepID=A0A165CN29_EXIGL|nr:hypothetical protein EXIGLDRAFT_335130 [Exidia glandulosa HHB12029]